MKKKIKKSVKKTASVLNGGAHKIRIEIAEKVSALVTAAFAFVAALAWNDAIQKGIQSLGLQKYGPLFYAILVTVIAVIVSIWMGKINGKLK